MYCDNIKDRNTEVCVQPYIHSFWGLNYAKHFIIRNAASLKLIAEYKSLEYHIHSSLFRNETTDK